LISRKQIKEWLENPVTETLRSLVKDEFENIVEDPATNSLIRGQPQLTQENLLESISKEHEWGAFLDILEGKWGDLDHLDRFRYLVEAESEDSAEPEVE